MKHDLIDETADRELTTEERLVFLLGRCYALEQNMGRLINALQESNVAPSLDGFLKSLIGNREDLFNELNQEVDNSERRGYLSSTIETGKTLRRTP